MDMPRPAAEHEKLKLFAGTWTGEETIYPSPLDPAGGVARARVENRIALDGFIVVQDYAQEKNGVATARGHGVFSYDARRRQYVMDWWDSFGQGRSEYRGIFQGDRIEFTTDTPMGKARATFDFPRGDRYTFKMEISMDGTKWAPFMEGQYTRAS
jgi:hypothetical protein